MAVIMDEQKAEKVSFLGNTVNRKAYRGIEEPSRCCCGWSKKKICCCTCLGIFLCLIIGLVVLCLMFFVFKHGDKSSDAAKWEQELNSGDPDLQDSSVTMDGFYSLQSYDDQYEPYLRSLGIPWYVIPIILATSETLAIKVTGDTVEVETETSWKTQALSFDFGKEFNISYGRGMGTMWNVCKRPSPLVWTCRSEERERGWELLSKMTFSQKGIVNERTFVNENIKAKKYYKREESEAFDESFEKEEDQNDQGSSTKEFHDLDSWEDDDW